MNRLKTKIKSWHRNARVLFGDVSYRRNLKMFAWVLGIFLVAFVVLWYLGVGIRAEVYKQGAGDGHTLTFHEYLFSVLGAIDADPGTERVSAMYAAFVRLSGAILIGGVLTSFLCSLLERFSDMTLRGKLVPTLSDHTIIVGYAPLTDDIVRTVLSDDRSDLFANWFPYHRARGGGRNGGKVLLYTSGDVRSIRDSLNSVLNKGMSKRVVYAFGSMDMSDPKMAREICERLNILKARSVIILGDACDPVRGDLKNLAFAAVAGGYVRRKRIKAYRRKVRRLGEVEKRLLRYRSDEIPMPFYVQMDDVSTFDLMKHMEYKIGSRKNRNEICLDAVGAYIRPFSYYEGWARAIWGAPYAMAPHYYPLDFRPMDKKSYVHLVVAGLSKAGEALVIEALRICHYPHGGTTRITIVDADPRVEEDFHVHHREVFGLSDVKIEFKIGRLQSESVQEFIASEARNRDCLLTVAICLRNIEQAILEGLCLPRDVFYGFDGQEGVAECERVAKRLEYPRYPPRVLVYQEHVNGRPEQGDSALPVRYRWLRPFGMQEEGVQTRCMRSFASMYLNAVFFWPIDADGASFLDLFPEEAKLAGRYPDVREAVEAFRGKWRDPLSRNKPSEIPVEERYRLLTLVMSKDDSLLDAFKKYAFRRFVLMEPVKEWSNVYGPDSYGTILRSIGLEARRQKGFDDSSARDFLDLLKKNEARFEEGLKNMPLERSLEEVEHARWMADRALMGYRPNKPEEGEKRDDGYRYHNAMRTYAELSEADRNKDALVIRFMPMFLALEGFAIEGRTTT